MRNTVEGSVVCQAKQPLLSGVAHQLQTAVEAQLGLKVGSVTLDGSHAEKQFLGGLAIRVALSNEAKDLSLPRCERLNWLVLRGWCIR